MSQIYRHLHKIHGIEWTGYVSIVNNTFKAHKENHAAYKAHHKDAPVEKDRLNQHMKMNVIENFDERSFFEKLQKIENLNDSIRSIVNLCLEKRQAAYKIIRTFHKSFKEGNTHHKLKIFYILHELSLKSKENEFEDLRRRLAESILFILPDVLESAPVEKVDRCVDIWRRWKIFENDMMDRFDRIVESRKQDQPETTLKKQKQKRNYEPLASGSELVERPLKTRSTEEKDVSVERIPLESRLQQQF